MSAWFPDMAWINM